MLQELVTLMWGNKYKTGLCPCTCWWLRRHLRKTCRFFLAFPKYCTSFKLWCYVMCVKIAACRLDIDSVVKHTSHTRSVIDAGTSAVDVAPGKGVVCWRASCIYYLSRAHSAK